MNATETADAIANGRVDMAKAFRLFCGPGSIAEIRALGCRMTADGSPFTQSGYFDSDHQAGAVVFAHDCEKLNATGVYIVMNPPVPDLLARSANRGKRADAGGTTKDREILSRRWLLVDCDPVRHAGISSDETELAAALEKVKAVAFHLEAAGFARPVIAMSGNGYHLLYRIDLPADDGGLVEGVLKALDQQFSSEAVKIDTAVHNAARITKFYGTLARKGDAIPGRPHRHSQLIEVPADLQVTPREAIEAIASQFVPSVGQVSIPGATSDDRLRVEHWLTRHGVTILAQEKTEDGADRYFIPCPGIDSHTNRNADRDCCVTLAPDGAHGGKCVHESCGMPNWQAIKTAIGAPEFEDYHETPDTSGVDTSAICPARTEADDVDDDEEEIGYAEIDFPKECLNPPGLIGRIVDYSLATALYPQPEHSLAGALAFMSLITGRLVADRRNTRTNLLIIALGPTRSGKEHPRAINKKLLELCGKRELYEEKLASHSALHGFLKTPLYGLVMNDEFGDFLATARATKGANTQPAQILTAITKLYSSSSGNYKADRYADNTKQVEINQPHLVLYGTSTGEVFWKHVTPEYLSGGLFGRVMIFENRGYVDPGDGMPLSIPEDIYRGAEYWLDQPSHKLVNWPNPTPTVVAHDLDAWERFKSHELAISHKRKKETPIRAALWSGCAEISAKLALLFACSRSPNPLQIKIGDVELAIRLSNWLTRRKVELSGDHVAENATEAANKRVLLIVKKAGAKGITKHQLSRKTQWLKGKEREDVIKDLKQSQQITEATRGTTGQNQRQSSRKTPPTRHRECQST